MYNALTNVFVLLEKSVVGHQVQCMSENQGWEFTQQFSERIARFLRKNEQISHLLKKRAIRLFSHFW